VEWINDLRKNADIELRGFAPPAIASSPGIRPRRSRWRTGKARQPGARMGRRGKNNGVMEWWV